jgi:hypothetical protein
VAAIRLLARWLAWQIGDATTEPLNHPPAHITVFSSDGAVEEF